MQDGSSRRDFVSFAVAQAGAFWLTACLPAVAAAASHAHRAAQAGERKFEFFTREQAEEIEAIAAQIIPADDTPGAREAGVIYFIDRALVSFDHGNQPVYKEGLEQLSAAVRSMFPGSERFSLLTLADQTKLLHAIEHPANMQDRHASPTGHDVPFFELVRVHTIVGFFSNPEYGGNRDGIGWKLIGQDSAHAFEPPFGYYDRDSERT